jgi:uncharacterized protein (PEP-CTERM system associated)
MATMAMGMAQKIKTLSVAIISVVLSTPAMSGEWEFNPNIILDETYSDNVTLQSNGQESSFVNQTGVSINSIYHSRLADFSFQGTSTYASYTHDHSLDDSFNTLSTNGQLSLWSNGPKLTASANIGNSSRNGARNSLADIVSADTVETRNFQTGLIYNINNSQFQVDSSINYTFNEADDNIGENEGYNASLYSENGSAARYLFWQIQNQYADRENRGLNGEQYRTEAIIGVITPYRINPFIRYYDEDNSGDIITRNNLSLNSWGPGFRWLASSQLYIDTSYNFVEDDEQNDDYLAVAINWQPSSRTSLKASVDNRFFDESYALDFTHRNRRLTNTIIYKETVEAFDRNNYQSVALGSFWCPRDVDINNDISNCLLDNGQQIDFDNFQLTSLFGQELIDANEFSLNKNLSWNSELKLARTTFTLSVNDNERESLTTGIINDTFNTSFTISRKISGRSNVDLTANFQHQQYDKNNLNGAGQNDYYRRVSGAYNKELARTLSMRFSLQYLNRDSNRQDLSYNETRVLFNLTKDF